MDGAGAAERHAAAELGAGKADTSRQCPQKRHVGGRVHVLHLAVECSGSPCVVSTEAAREVEEMFFVLGTPEWLPDPRR